MTERMLTPDEVAAMYKVHGNTVRRWCQRGLLRAVKEGGSKYRGDWSIPESALKEFLPPRPGRPPGAQRQ
jgi:excisionase family DNA binding protein